MAVQQPDPASCLDCRKAAFAKAAKRSHAARFSALTQPMLSTEYS